MLVDNPKCSRLESMRYLVLGASEELNIAESLARPGFNVFLKDDALLEFCEWT